jgi:hypothetical protein
MSILRRDMEELVGTCRREIPRAFESDDYTHRVEDARVAAKPAGL